jgi:hypothetical protein
MRIAFATLALPLVTFAPLACAPANGEGEGEGEGEEGEGEGDVLVEEEDNGGDPITAVNALPLGATIAGVIGAPGDADVFHLEGTTPGHLYRATLVARGGLDGHLTILDDGRNGDAPGSDYVRLHRAPDGPDAVVEFAALGGGVFVIARDARDVDGDGAGGADFGYDLVVDDITDAVLAASVTPPDDVSGALALAGSVFAINVDVDTGADLVVDVGGAGDADLRAFVVSTSAGDWVARNDDRAVDDTAPLIDAPLFEEGPYFLLIENGAEGATANGAVTLAVQ